jgi:hypothetical protein
MRKKVERIAYDMAQRLAACPETECVTIGPAAEIDVLDPYFSLVLDAFWKGAPPNEETRRKIYANSETLELDTSAVKDRLIIDDIPVHIDYKSVENTSDFFRGDESIFRVLQEAGTHRLYRLKNNHVLFDRSGWIGEVRAKLDRIPGPFWEDIVSAFARKLEHTLSDFGATVLRQDDYFYTVTLGNFSRFVVSFLFAVNREFEPAHRFVSERILKLPILPEDFAGRWETLLRYETELTPSRKYEIAKLIAKSCMDLLG